MGLSTRWGWLWRLRWPVIILLLLGIGVWWHLRQQPARMTRVKTFAMSETLIPLANGFLTEENYTYILRDWQGADRWAIKLSGISDSIAISPDGRWFARLQSNEKRLRVTLYCDGVYAATHLLPVPPAANQYAMIAIIDDGRAFINCQLNTNSYLYVVQEKFLLAQGPILYEGTVSPDGTLVAALSGQYASLVYQHGKVVQGAVKSVTGDMHLDEYGDTGCGVHPALCDGGLLITQDGALYDARGLKTPAPRGNWQQDRTTSIHSRYTVLMRDGRYRVLCPATGDAWEGVCRPAHGYDLTDDGRFVVAYLSGASDYPALQQLAELLHLPQLDREWNLIIERPGRIRAIRDAHHGEQALWVSQDGHAMVIRNRDEDRIELYRW